MRFKSIDSLRGLAASAVVFYHMWNRFYLNETTQGHPGFPPAGKAGFVTFFLFGFGYLGVDLFFVLSGFCIHLPQALKFQATGTDRLDLGRFAKRRFWRLYPAYFASLVWTSLVLLALPLAEHLARHTPLNLLQAVDARGFLTNALFLLPFNQAAAGFNGVYWTLAYELQFYIFYPALLWACRRWGFNILLVVLLVCEVGLILKPVPVPFFFLGRFFEWYLGMFLAEHLAAKKPLQMPKLVFPVLLAVSIATVFHPMTWPFRDLIASIAFAALLAICLPRERSSHWLSNPRLVALGVWSYSLYLVHIPMIDLVWKGLLVVRMFVPAIPQWLAVVSVPAAFCMAYVFFLCFEKPFLGERKARVLPSSGVGEQAW